MRRGVHCVDALLLSRIQFGFVISFHILFPAFTIGLASWLVSSNGAGCAPSDDLWRDLYFFWLKIFAVSFGMGVVSGIVMSFQFGTNWAAAQRAGRQHPRPAAQLRSADRLLPRSQLPRRDAVRLEEGLATLHFFAPAWSPRHADLHVLDHLRQQLDADAAGLQHRATACSTPSTGGQIVFNPSFPYRLAHMVLAAFITTCFVMAGECLAPAARRAREQPASGAQAVGALGALRCRCRCWWATCTA
jgi:cytochrome d ubiquinol oxidase subunit I